MNQSVATEDSIDKAEYFTKWYACCLFCGCVGNTDLVVATSNPSGKRIERQVVTMAMEEQSLGLCLTCNSKAVCTRRKGIRFPVLFCEEFDDSTSLDAKGAMASTSLSKKSILDTSMGLCCNCGNRDKCTLCHLPGGIWHCEEYQ